MKNLRQALLERKANHLYRRRRTTDSPQQPVLVIDGRTVINFCSNDYLGLANHPDVKQAMIDGVRRYGAGSGAAHLVSGHSRAHHLLEEELAAFTGYPRALLFSTGYMANIGIAQALAGRGDAVVEDRLNHASLIDGGLLSGARLLRYAHNDAADLRARLAQRPRDEAQQRETLVMTDGVFSMDGDIADLPAIVDACAAFDARLVVDDAHGFGVIGASGRGTLEHFGVAPGNVPVYMATLGKALGTFGAFVAGGEDIVETLIQLARSGIYTTASPPALAEATRAGLRLLQGEPSLRLKLHENIAYFRDCAAQAGVPVSASTTAIQPVIIGDSSRAVAASDRLLQDGLLVTAIRPPTVPQGTARLRVTLSASHNREQIDRLVESLAAAA